MGCIGMLSQLQKKAAMKPALEAKLAELQTQKRDYEQKVTSLRAAFRKEQADVERLEGRSLANYFFQVVGRLDEKLDQERQEAYAAKVKLDAAQRELEGIERDLQSVKVQLSEASVAEAQFRPELEKKYAALKASGTGAADAILKMEGRIAAKEAQRQEIREAIYAGKSAAGAAEGVLAELRSAEGWNTWDLFGGDGIITHMAKHSHLDDAQELVSELQSKLRRFKTELADIHITANMQVNIDGFLRFADYFFDGLFSDWAVGNRISQSITAVTDTKRQIGCTLEKLADMEKTSDQEIEKLRQKLDDLIVKA